METFANAAQKVPSIALCLASLARVIRARPAVTLKSMRLSLMFSPVAVQPRLRALTKLPLKAPARHDRHPIGGVKILGDQKALARFVEVTARDLQPRPGQTLKYV